MTAAVILDMPEDEYHAHPALSQSGAKLILKAPSLYRWRMDHPQADSEALDHGKAAHLLVLGVGAELVLVEADSWRTKAAQEARAEARAAGKVPLLPDQYAVIQAMADRLSEHRLAMELLSRGDPEVSLFATDPTTGVPIRGRLDWLSPAIATDYKTTRELTPDAFKRTCATFGYHMQAAWYLDLLELVGQPREAFAFIVQAKEPPYDVFVTDLTGRAIDRGRELNARAIERFRDCTASGQWPPAVSPSAYITTDLPAWAYYDNDLEEHSA